MEIKQVIGCGISVIMGWAPLPPQQLGHNGQAQPRKGGAPGDLGRAARTRPTPSAPTTACRLNVGWQLVLAGGGAFLGRVLTGGRGRLVTGLASSILIGVLAVHLLVTALRSIPVRLA